MDGTLTLVRRTRSLVTCDRVLGCQGYKMFAFWKIVTPSFALLCFFILFDYSDVLHQATATSCCLNRSNL